ncbi:MAG: GNAT family N-acetyltransferase [Flavobacterium psychrophilum]|nr:MAG: GNAT family N-acetyltransferase [Flavobacterium psychrophilum]
MIRLVRTDSSNPDFQKLVRSLDTYLADRDGDDHAFYDQYNKIDAIKNVIVAYENENRVGCGAFKEYEKGTAEIKRMFVPEENRGHGIASKVLSELEKWALEEGFDICILETVADSGAVFLYKKSGYEIIPNYGQYVGMNKSCCMQKTLKNTH